MRFDKNSQEHKRGSDVVDAVIVTTSVTKFASAGGIDAGGLVNLLATGWDYKEVQGNIKKDIWGKAFGMYFACVIKSGKYKNQMCALTEKVIEIAQRLSLGNFISGTIIPVAQGFSIIFYLSYAF